MFRGTPSASLDQHGVAKRLALVIDWLPGGRPDVLDVGCGLGLYLEALSAQSARATGIDISYEYLRSCAGRVSRPNTSLIQMDVQHLAFSQNSFDAAIMIETLEHIPNGAAAIREISRVLKADGIVIISVPSKLFLFETHPVRIGRRTVGSRWGTGIPLLPLLPRWVRKHFATVRLYHPWELRQMLEMNGLAVCKVEFLMPSLDTLGKKLPVSWDSVVRSLKRALDWLEGSPLRVLGSTIVVRAKRVA